MASVVGRILFENESTKDITLVTMNKEEIKCHKTVLSQHSAVLDAMLIGADLNNNRGKSVTTISMREWSTDSVEYFVLYLYSLESPPEELTSRLASEVLQIATKYAVWSLAESMKKIILEKDASWFKPNVILGLYLYTRTTRGLQDVKLHSLRIIKSMSKDIRECDVYRDLNPITAMDLLWDLVDLV